MEPEDPFAEAPPRVLMLGERRGAKHGGKFDLCELFGPPRISSRARERGYRAGWCLDCNYADPVTGRRWNMTDSRDQDKIIRMIKQDKPLVLGISPDGCSDSALFAVRAALEQMRQGRYFCFQSPINASLWQSLEQVRDLQDSSGVETVLDHSSKIPIRILTNLPSIASAIHRRCKFDFVSNQSAVQSFRAVSQCGSAFVDGVIDGVAVCLDWLDCFQKGKCLFDIADEPELYDMSNDMCSDDYSDVPFVFQDHGWYVDDVRGGELPKELVRAARKNEMDGFAKRHVYEVRPRTEATAKGAKVVGVRWVDSLKGDGVRSRLVCQDFNTGKKTDDMFAPTPPLLGSRWLVSQMASQGTRGPGNKRLMSIDFTKAFLYGSMQREVYIDLPDEDGRKKGGMNVGLLLQSMYGLRDAPLIWQRVVRKMLKKRGFRPLVTAQSMYYNPSTGVTILAHVDDFLCFGDRLVLDLLLRDLQTEFECSGQVLGPGADEVREITFLGRTIRCTSFGLEWEGDERHVKSFLDKVGLSKRGEAGGRGGKGVETPGVKHDEDEDQRKPMDDKEATEYRGLVALLNFISQDRADVAYASKEVSRRMSSPCESDMVSVKRIGRYLRQNSRSISLFRWQSSPMQFHVYSDSDWGGCTSTRKSTSGGCIMAGSHLLAHWSRTQQNVALSSGEAELNGLCKATQEGLAAKHISEEVGESWRLTLCTDSSAARGIIQRQGAGKVKHLSVKQLWVQELETQKELDTMKVPRERNFADLLTHHWTRAEGARFFGGLGLEIREFRS